MDHSDNLRLHFAAKSNNLEAAELLLSEKVDIHFEDENGLTPLCVLIQNRLEMFDSLHAKENEELENYTPHDVRYGGFTKPIVDQKRRRKFEREKKEFLYDLHKKIDRNEQFIEMLLKHKSSKRNCVKDVKLLNFYAACILQNSSVAENLSDHIDDINKSVSKKSHIYPGYTALHFAAHCNLNIVKMLISKGAELLIQDVEGITPLQICIKSFSMEDVHSILTLTPAWQNTLFSDGKTKLVDYIFSLRTAESHKEFLRNMGKKVGIYLSKKSLLWPGYTIAHIAVTLLPKSNSQVIQDILTINSNLATVQDVHGSTPVHLAFRHEKLKFLHLLLQCLKESVNLTDDENLSYLHIAAAVNNKTLAQKLLQGESNFNVAYKGKALLKVKLDWTPLHVAVKEKNSDIVELLLKQGANLLQIDAQGFTPIHLLLGTKLQHQDRIDRMVFSTAQLKDRVVENVGLTHLHVAVWKVQTKAIEKLLDLGADIDATIGKVNDEELKKFEGCRPIHVALMDGWKSHIFALLVQRGADIFARKLDGSNPLIEIFTGEYDRGYLKPIVELLWSNEELEKRFEKEFGLKLIHVVCYALDQEKVENLLQAKVNVNARIRDDSNVWPGFTPLHVLVCAGMKIKDGQTRSIFTSLLTSSDKRQDIIDNLCDLLLRKGADVTLADVKWDTPVLMAFKDEFPDKVYNRADFLLQNQSDHITNPTNFDGMSHFHAACFLLDVAVVEDFFKSNPDINVNQTINTNSNSIYAGQTPLILASSHQAQSCDKADNQIQIVNLLLDHGASVDVVDAFGQTALHKITSNTLTRIVLFEKLLVGNVDINRRADDGKTVMEMMLREGVPSNEIYYLLTKGARINSYNPVSDVGYMAIVIESDKYNRAIKQKQFNKSENKIYEIMMNLSDITEVSDTGRNAIHNIVASEKTFSGDYRYVNYYDSLEDLVKLGCDIFHQDNQGRTALHLAVKFQNGQAIKALLKCGADINIVDCHGKSPFSYASEFRKSSSKYIPYDSNAPFCEFLARHVRKLQLVGLQVSELNAKLLETILNERDDIEIKFEIEDLNDELQFASEFKIGECGFTLRDFLHPTRVVNLYSSLNQDDRDTIDAIFKPEHKFEFPLLESCLRMQYRKALERPCLIESAVNELRILSQYPIPDLCAEIIFTDLTNLDLKNMMAATTVGERKNIN